MKYCQYELFRKVKFNNNKMFLKFLLILPLIFLTTAQCPINKDIDQLVTGSLSFLCANLQSQTALYTFKTPFSATPKVAIAINHFDIKKSNHGSFNVKTGIVRTSDMQIDFSRVSKIWSKLRVNFFATTRNDIMIGTGAPTFQELSNKVSTVVVSYSEDMLNYDKAVHRVFLNGYEYKGSTISLEVWVRQTSIRSCLISVNASKDFTLLRLYYSYIAFIPEQLQFYSYGGTFSMKNFSGGYFSNIYHFLVHHPSYILHGLTLIELSGNDSIEFVTSVDQDFIAGVYSSRVFDNFQVAYIVMGPDPLDQCSQCLKQQVYAYRQHCLTQCPNNTELIKFGNSSYECKVCSNKLNQKIYSGQCNCIEQSILLQKQCKSNQQPLKNFIKSFKSHIDTTATCQHNCNQTNQYWAGSRCICKLGYKNQSNQCVPLVSDSTICLRKFQFFNGQACVCWPGYNRVDDLCNQNSMNHIISACLIYPNKRWINSLCSCKTGFMFIDGSCVPMTSNQCPPNSQRNGTNGCTCLSGFIQDPKTSECLKVQPCPASSSKFPNGTCVCDQGLVMHKNLCSKCPPGLIWDEQISRCLYKCEQNAIHNETFQKCQCLPGFGIYFGICNPCPQNFFIKNGYCVQCLIKSGFSPNSQGICVQKCGINEVWDPSSSSCKSSKSLRKNCDGAECLQSTCQKGRFFDSVIGDCVLCKLGCLSCESDNICTSCSKKGYKVIAGQCLSVCGDGQLAEGQHCDDGNTIDRDGCTSTCLIQLFYSCKGNPSVCTPIKPR